MDRRFLGILVVLVLIFGGFFLFFNHGSSNTGSAGNEQPTSHIEGKGLSGVKLQEYGDYECPVCAEYYQVVKQLAAQFNSQIFFQFSNLPLSQIHQNAYASARAAEAAGLQGKYWEMHDKLYVNQNDWASASNPQSKFDGYAKAIGLNLSQFDSDYKSDKVNQMINADINAFSKTGQPQATPTFYLDGKYVEYSKITDSNGQPNISKFASLIQAEIDSKANH